MTKKEKNRYAISTKPTLVVGLGKTGLSCVRFLMANGVPVAVTDSRDNPPCLAEFQKALDVAQEQVPCSVGGFDAGLFEWAQRLIVSPGVSIEQPAIKAARERGAEIIGDIELFARSAQAPVVAITGSNGKSTVTMLMYEMAKDAGKYVLVGGNIGTPALDLLLEPTPDLYVLELSSFQLEITTSLKAVASVVLNVSPDHMDRYHDLEHYIRTKQRVYGVENREQGESGRETNKAVSAGAMIVNRDDDNVMAMSQRGRKVVSFGLGEPSKDNYGRIHYQGNVWLARGHERLLPVSEIGLAGEHNQANALAALALGEQVGLPMISMLNTLRHFSGLPHRTQWVADIDGVAWYNDSKGTNVGATVSAIRGFTSPVVLIAGGQGKGADFSPLRDVVGFNTRAVILLGVDAPLIENALADLVPVTRVKDMDSAVQAAYSVSQPGDVVLLSPACASFDMFAGFEARGDAFVRAVHRLKKGEVS